MIDGTYPTQTKMQSLKPGLVIINGGEIVIEKMGLVRKPKRIPAAQVATVTMDEKGLFFKKGSIVLHGAGGHIATIEGKLPLLRPIYHALNS